MPFPARLPPPATAAAATAAAVLAAVALRRYLSSRSRAATAASAHSTSGAPAATTFLVLSGKSPQDQQLLASAAGELSLAEEGGGELAVSLALDASGDAGFDAAVYMGALQARCFGRWMHWSPRMASTHVCPAACARPGRVLSLIKEQLPRLLAADQEAVHLW